MPNGITHDELFAWGGFVNVKAWDFATMAKRYRQDMRGFGPGMMALPGEGGDARPRHPCARLDAGPRCLRRRGRRNVVGVRAEREGKDFWARAEARRGVLLRPAGTTGTRRWRSYFEHLPEWQSMVQPSVAGDAMVMAGEVGAAIAGGAPAQNLGLFFGYQVPGELHDDRPLWRGSVGGRLLPTPSGSTAPDKSLRRRVLSTATTSRRSSAWDGVSQTQPNFPPYLVFDSNLREKAPARHLPPGARSPGGASPHRAGSLGELGEKLGIDGEGTGGDGRAVQPLRRGGRRPRLRPRDLPLGRHDDRRQDADEEPEPRAPRQAVSSMGCGCAWPASASTRRASRPTLRHR